MRLIISSSAELKENPMTPIHAEVTHMIDARPEDVYAIFTDYREAHPAILPKPYFTDLSVEQGGTGAGTVITVRMKVLGMERVYHLTVSEPQPGRVLVETDPDAGVVTTFTVEPMDGGTRSRVTIASDSQISPGFAGLMERLISPAVTRRIYHAELAQVADYIRHRSVPTR
jgi:hypothetical protein